MICRDWKGFALGTVSSVCYGTNPLMAVPLYAAGFTVMSVLTWRYAIATAVLGLAMIAAGHGGRLRLRRGEVWLAAVSGVLFALSSVLLFESYRHMDVGLASTLLYVEPVFIALTLRLTAGERIGRGTWGVIAVCMAGVAALCSPGEGAWVTAEGIVLVLLSSLTYAIYMVIIDKTRIARLSSESIAFYSLLFGLGVFAVLTRGFSDVQHPVAGWLPAVCMVGVAVFPTVVSLLTAAAAVKRVGPVVTGILSAFEPVTGLAIGVTVFGETLTPRACAGVALILFSVTALVAMRQRRSTGSGEMQDIPAMRQVSEMESNR